ncbi:MAG TPA: oxidoreductase [Solibacterales bacterium]|nr:oxidoreductase [Bryobacterales bacterium]
MAAMTIERRTLLGGAAFAAVAGAQQNASRDKLNIAGVGIGAMGGGYLRECESENIVALADVDDVYAAKTFARYPNAARYRDWRKLLEREKAIDAVIIGTPDHTHAQIALAAIELGKHVYCAKPMTRTIEEARAVAKAAREKKVATQMSVQSCASEEACQTEEWVRSGIIGKVREVHTWSDRPVWPQGLPRPEQAVAPPDTFDWDLWLGGAPKRPFHPVYHPFNWRGWYDFGTGALGDMGCHTLHIIFRALELPPPVSASASSNFIMVPAPSDQADQPWMRSRTLKTPETFPHAAAVTWDFPGGVRVFWYDGGLKPPRPPQLDPEAELPRTGLLFLGEKGALLSGFAGGRVRLLPESKHRDMPPPAKTIARSIGHYKEWIDAAKGGPAPNCNFQFGALITETALLGVEAIRTGKTVRWHA